MRTPRRSVSEAPTRSARAILFGALRALEKKHDCIIAVWTRKGEVADSVLNRLKRSAGNNIF